MAQDIRTFSVTVTTGSSKTAPQRTAIKFPPRVVRQIRVRIPPGPCGTVGFQIGNAQQQVIPINAGGWIVTDNETLAFTLSGYVTSGTWWLIAYNQGTFAHTLSITFYLTLIGPVTPPRVNPATPGALSTPGPMATPATFPTLAPLPSLPTLPAPV